VLKGTVKSQSVCKIFEIHSFDFSEDVQKLPNVSKWIIIIR